MSLASGITGKWSSTDLQTARWPITMKASLTPNSLTKVDWQADTNIIIHPYLVNSREPLISVLRNSEIKKKN